MTDMNISGFVVHHGEERLLGVHAVLGPCLDDPYSLSVVGVDKEGTLQVIKDYRYKFQFCPVGDVPDWAAVHGRWEPHCEVVNGEIHTSQSKRVCSVCKDIWESSTVMDHCPGCGAKMDLP